MSEGSATVGEKLAAGKAYEVKLTTGIEFKGLVLAYDSNMVIFQDKPMPETGDSITTRMVNSKCITSFRLLGTFKEDPLLMNDREVDLTGLLAKEENAIRDIGRLGVGVTKEAQSIFDTLSKTFTVKWDKKDILVGKVRVCSPYTCDRVSGGTTLAKNEVKKVLEREKLQLGSGKEDK